MKTVYFDSSAYVKLFAPEPGSDIADLLFRLAHLKRIQIWMSYWTINETSAAIDRKHRRREISNEEYDIISATIIKNLIYYADEDSNVGLVSLDDIILKNSIDVIINYHVSADDALHLYTAFFMKCDYFLCHDDKLVNRTNKEISNMKVLSITDAAAMLTLMKEFEQ